MPSLNKCTTKSTRRLFSIILKQLSKFDLQEKRVLTYDVEEGLTPGEPVFLARPGATKEDDGKFSVL